MVFVKLTGKKRFAKKRYARKGKKVQKQTMEQKMRKIALGVIHKQAENKITIQNLTLTPVSNVAGSGIDWNGTTGTNGLVLPTIIPPITQGSGTGAREGNKVEPRYLQIRGVVQTNIGPLAGSISTPTSVTASAPFYLHMFIYRLKGNIFNSDLSRLLQGGTAPGSALPFDGSLLRSTYPFNKDAYTVLKHRVFKMATQPQFLLTGSSLLPQPVSDDGWGNGFKMSHIFKQSIKIKKSWLYDDSVTNQPTNDNMFVAFAVVNADGTINAPSVNRCSVACESVLEFEDL